MPKLRDLNILHIQDGERIQFRTLVFKWSQPLPSKDREHATRPTLQADQPQ